MTSSTLLADPPSNETIDVFCIKKNLPGRGLTKVEKHCSSWFVWFVLDIEGRVKEWTSPTAARGANLQRGPKASPEYSHASLNDGGTFRKMRR